MPLQHILMFLRIHPCYHLVFTCRISQQKPAEPSEMKENSRHIDELHMAKFVAARNNFYKSGSEWHISLFLKHGLPQSCVAVQFRTISPKEKKKKLMCFAAKNCRGCTFKQVLALTVFARRHLLEQREHLLNLCAPSRIT